MPGARRQGAGRGALAPLSGRRAWRLLLLHAALIQAVTSVVRPTAAYRALELDTAPELLGMLPAGFAVLPLLVKLLRRSRPDGGPSDGAPGEEPELAVLHSTHEGRL